jgi:2-polyprenyl-3-methyl-5-hydroxy-6-metoxy-1,4-benzoquinol methylase
LRKGILVDCNAIEELYSMMLDEIAQPNYDEREVALFKDPIFYYGRYLDPKTRAYAIHNVVSNISAAIEYLKLSGDSPVRIVDLGCGLGMQSIIFASLGTEVLGIDLDARCIALCRKRKHYFEARLGRALKVEFLEVNFRAFDPNSIGNKYDGLFSMSAFAHIQPLRNTVAKISTLLNDTGRVFLWDQNPDYLFLDVLRRRRRSLPRPHEIEVEFARHGFTTELLGGACAIPHHFWHPEAFLRAASTFDSVLKKSLRLSFSYLFGASRKKQCGPCERSLSDARCPKTETSGPGISGRPG